MLRIADWLEQLGLGQYCQSFAENAIDETALVSLTDADLKELGVGPLGHRKKLLGAIASLTGTPQDSAQTRLIVAPPAAAERRHLTVMFVDLVGSTALTQRLDPEEMREVIRAYQNAVVGEITRLEGFTAKLMGDGVLAYFGWPHAHEDEAERAVRAGLAVVSAVSRLPLAAGEVLAARVGIATGLVVVGDLAGEGASQEQAVVGDTPNLAARLQGIAEPGMVVVAEVTRRLLGDLFVLCDLGAQNLKGMAEQVSAHAVLNERAIESRFVARQADGVAPIVGRDQELALLLDRWLQARSGEGQVILLAGEAGIGKSRLTEALVETIGSKTHILLRYQCSPYHEDSALYPVIQQLNFAAGFVASDDMDRRLERLEILLAKATDDIREAASLLATLIGLNGESRYGTLALTPQQRRERMLAVLVDQLAGLAKHKPVLWVVEDAHWIDPTTLELIELALDRIQDTSVMLLITARPTFVASFASHPVVTRLALNRLARTATQAIVDRITRGKQLPEILLNEISARTDGVPLFVEEMTKAVIESGILREETDSYYLDGLLSSLKIPTTLHDSLMARLDRLRSVKELAQTASVIGRNFNHRTIASLSGLPERDLADAMGRLVEAELVFRRGAPPDATYLFKHALVRDAAYESLLNAKRIALHVRLLDVLEATGEASPEVKAQHAEAAGLAERALEYWEQAGTQAAAKPAYKEAITSLENAVRLCRSMGEDEQHKRREYSLHLQLGQAFIANQGYQAAPTVLAFERALTLAYEVGDLSLQLPALYGKWGSAYVTCQHSGEAARRFAALAETLPETGPRLIGWRILACECFHEGRLKESIALARKSLDAFDPVQHPDLVRRFAHDPQAMAMVFQAWSLWHLGSPDQAARMIEESERSVRKVNHANALCLALCHGVTILNIWLRRPYQVEAAAREALRLAKDNAMPLWHAWAQIHLGWAMSQLSSAAGLNEIETGLREAQQIGAARHEPFHHSLAADAYARAGRHDDAEASIAKAFAASTKDCDPTVLAELHRMRAAVTLGVQRNQRDAAEADLRHALAIARQQEAMSLQLRSARDLASLMADRGDRQQGIDLLAPIFDWFTEGLDTPDLREAKALLDEIRS